MAIENDKPLRAQRWALWWALAAYVVFLAVYLCTSDLPFIHIREQADKWGQFGDYVGGVINPIVGLITIWLLTASLKQSQKEMELTRKALKDAQKSQEATEAALRDQLKVSEHARDMNNASTLYGHSTKLIRAYKHNFQIAIYSTTEAAIAQQELSEIERQRQILGLILDGEVRRLEGLYPGHKITQAPPKLPT